MPKGPRGEKRPADVIGNAVHVMRVATGEIEKELPPDDGKDKAAQCTREEGRGGAGGEAHAGAEGRNRAEGSGETLVLSVASTHFS